MASITKRINKSGVSYLIRVSAGYDMVGKQIVKTMTWRPEANMTERQAEKELTKVSVAFERDVENGGVSLSAKLKLTDFCDQYLTMSKGSLSPQTYKRYSELIETIIKPALGHMKLKDIRPIHVQRFIQELEGLLTANGQPVAASTVQRYFVAFKSIMGKAYKLGLISNNPTDTARLELPKVEVPEVEVFTKTEVEHLLEYLEDEPIMYRALIHLAIVTGARRGELVALKWEHINACTKSISIVQSNYKLAGEEIKTKSPKTRRSVREIAVPQYVLDILNKLHLEQMKKAQELGDVWHNDGWIFTQWNGEPMYPTTPTLWFDKFQKRHEIPHHKFHALRHTSATLLLTDGANIKTVAARLGHTQLSTTNRYVHALSEADVAAADSFSSLIQPIKMQNISHDEQIKNKF
jgi:Site-specific recombinase XerD